jgi:hypothetical protein
MRKYFQICGLIGCLVLAGVALDSNLNGRAAFALVLALEFAYQLRRDSRRSRAAGTPPAMPPARKPELARGGIVCPRCGLLNPKVSMQCDCGFRFERT